MFIVNIYAKDEKYYMSNFNISLDKPIIYKNIKLNPSDKYIFINELKFHVIITKYEYNVCYICINKRYGKYTVLIGFMLPGDDVTDLYLSANNIDNIDRFINFFGIYDPTKLKYYDRDISLKDNSIKKRDIDYNKRIIILE